MMIIPRSPSFRRLFVLAAVWLFWLVGCSGTDNEPRQASKSVPQPTAEQLAKLRAPYEFHSPLAMRINRQVPPGFREWSLRETAADALARIGRPAVPALIRALSDPDPELRHQAARALSRMGPSVRDAVPALIRALKDPDPLVRRSAARALGQVGPDAAIAIPALVEAMRSKDDTETNVATDLGPGSTP